MGWLLFGSGVHPFTVPLSNKHFHLLTEKKTEDLETQATQPGIGTAEVEFWCNTQFTALGP
jgi:hypothetical protein